MGAFVREANGQNAANIRPIVDVLSAELQSGRGFNGSVFRDLQIDLVVARRRSPMENMQMQANEEDDEPFLSFVRLLEDPERNELRNRMEWGETVADEFTRFARCFSYAKLFPDGTTFRYCGDITEDATRVDHYSRLPTFPVSCFLLNAAVAQCMKSIYGDDHLAVLAGSDDRIRAFFGCNVDIEVARSCILSL